jgi:hypothetical protein
MFCKSTLLFSQENIQISGGINLLSQQYWRGFSLSSVPGIQAETSFSYGNFNFCLWAALASNLKYSEIDLIPSYTIDNFEIMINHYYNPVYGQYNNFFDFGSENNRHSTEIFVIHNANKIPLNLSIGTFIFGDKNSMQQPNFSTYIEIAYPFSLKWADAEISAGISPFKGYYAQKTAIIHSGFTLSRNIEMKNGFSLPLSLALNYNPHFNKLFVVAKAGIFR